MDAPDPEAIEAAWFGLTAPELAELADVHVTTARRWLRQRQAPSQVSRCLELLRAGHLGALARAWSGWSIRGGFLVSPEGERFAPGDVRAAPYDRDQVRELRRALEAATNTVMSSGDRRRLVRAIALLKGRLARSARAGELLEELLGEQLADRERDELFELSRPAAAQSD